MMRLIRFNMLMVMPMVNAEMRYNVVGLSLATIGVLPPMLAAAAQPLPDLGILGNSSRLIRHR